MHTIRRGEFPVCVPGSPPWPKDNAPIDNWQVWQMWEPFNSSVCVSCKDVSFFSSFGVVTIIFPTTLPLFMLVLWTGVIMRLINQLLSKKFPCVVLEYLGVAFCCSTERYMQLAYCWGVYHAINQTCMLLRCVLSKWSSSNVCSFIYQRVYFVIHLLIEGPFKYTI